MQQYLSRSNQKTDVKENIHAKLKNVKHRYFLSQSWKLLKKSLQELLFWNQSSDISPAPCPISSHSVAWPLFQTWNNFLQRNVLKTCEKGIFVRNVN